MTRAEKFRTGGRIAWIGGGLFTGSLIYSFSPYKGLIAFAVCVIIAFAFQYLLTIIESVMVYGEIPHPLHKDSTITHKWIWAAAFACLAIDVYINFNGILYLLNLLNKDTEADKDVMAGAAVVLSVLVAMAPEVCNAYCDMLEGKGRQIKSNKDDQLPFKEDATLVENNRKLQSQNEGLIRRLKELEQQVNQAKPEQNDFNIGRRKR